jgi:hypothetical protein
MTVASVAKSSGKWLILFVGAAEEIRIPDPEIRSLVLGVIGAGCNSTVSRMPL